jgi:hypothetical protein
MDEEGLAHFGQTSVLDVFLAWAVDSEGEDCFQAVNCSSGSRTNRDNREMLSIGLLEGKILCGNKILPIRAASAQHLFNAPSPTLKCEEPRVLPQNSRIKTLSVVPAATPKRAGRIVTAVSGAGARCSNAA